MFSNKMLYIPDYVVSEDIPTIINYFDYYNIAKVKNVEVFNHIESEYLTEYNDFYGFALIEIDYYYDNQGARNFYSSIVNNKALIVYDDPNFWEVQFSTMKQSCISNVSNCNSDTNICSVINSQPHTNNKQEEVCYSSHEDNDCLDENYVYEETPDTLLDDDFDYNSYEKNFNIFKKKQQSKKQKLNEQLVDIKKTINDISTTQDKLLKLLLINNNFKNKKQKNKQKRDVKSSWNRRLRIIL